MRHWKEAERDLAEAASLDPGCKDVAQQQEALRIAKAEHEQEQLLAAASAAAAAAAPPAASTPVPESELSATPVSEAGAARTSMDTHQKLAQQLVEAQAPFALIQSKPGSGFRVIYTRLVQSC